MSWVLTILALILSVFVVLFEAFNYNKIKTCVYHRILLGAVSLLVVVSSVRVLVYFSLFTLLLEILWVYFGVWVLLDIRKQRKRSI